jgi:hypothetical protein
MNGMKNIDEKNQKIVLMNLNSMKCFRDILLRLTEKIKSRNLRINHLNI